MADALGELLGQQLKEQKSRTETQGLEPGTISSYFVFGNYRFRIRVTKVLIEQQNIDVDNIGIYGNPKLGIYGTNVYGTEAQLDAYATVEEIVLNQTIPTIARYEIANWLGSVSADNPDYMAIGYGTTAYADSDTTLETEIARRTITYDIATDKKIEYQLVILSTDSDFYQYNEDFTTTTYKDTDETTATWTGSGSIVF